MRHAFPAMGTWASILLSAPVPADVLSDVEHEIGELDAMFSLYRPDSALSAVANGTLALSDAPVVVRDEYARALDWREATDGMFTPHRPDGVIDLSGTIKAVAIDRAAQLLTKAGAQGMVGVGGDIAIVGDQLRPRIGIVDPEHSQSLLTSVDPGSRKAIATSGSAERGDHIWSALGATDVIQATVLADDIISADVLATTLVAAGSSRTSDFCARFDLDALVVTRHGMSATPGFRSAMNSRSHTTSGW